MDWRDTAGPSTRWYDGGGSDWNTAWFRVDPGQHVAVVRAGGEVDYATKAGLQVAMEAALQMSTRVVIDLTQVSFIDSSGLGAMIRARNRAKLRHGLVALASPPEMMRKVLAATHLQSMFRMYESVTEAVEGVTQE